MILVTKKPLIRRDKEDMYVYRGLKLGGAYVRHVESVIQHLGWYIEKPLSSGTALERTVVRNKPLI